MATQNLSKAHVATFNEQNELLIWETLGNRESVALTRKEVAVLRALIALPLTDEQINELILLLYSGFYQFDEIELKLMRSVVRDWIAGLNQPSGLAVSSSESEVCEWRVSADFDEGEYWATGCGNGWCIDSDGEYCPSCGKRVRYVEEKE